MILSQAAKYAIRAVLQLALHPDKPQLSKEVAAQLDIPSHFLAKVLQDLVRGGLLLSYKGRGGGFTLARPADQIRLLEVVQVIEGQTFGEACVIGLPECGDSAPCPLHTYWKEIKGDVFRMLEENSVGDMCDDADSRFK
jgi:Rrf2 family protein